MGQAFEKAPALEHKAAKFPFHPEAPEFIPSRSLSLLNPRAEEFRPATYTSKTNVLAGKHSNNNSMNPAVADFTPRAWSQIPICDKTELLRLDKSNTSIVPLDESHSLQAIQQSQKGQFIKRKVSSMKPIPEGPKGVEVTVRNENSKQYNGFLELNRQNHRLSSLSDSQCTPHHINWLGEPVDDKSQTPAALSLAIICSESKGLHVEAPEILQKSVPFNNAMQLIDPVVYIGSKGDLDGLTGTALQEAVTGATYKVYSPIGWWHDMDSEHWFPDEEMPHMDTHEDETLYQKDVVLNGWFENHGMPTRRTFVANEFNKNEQIKSASHERFIAKVGKTMNKSSLSKSMTTDESDIVEPTATGKTITVPVTTVKIQSVFGTDTKNEGTTGNSDETLDDGCCQSTSSTSSESLVDDIDSPIISPVLIDDTDETDVTSDDETDSNCLEFSEDNFARDVESLEIEPSAIKIKFPQAPVALPQSPLENGSELAPELSSAEQHQIWSSSKEIVVLMPGSDMKLKVVVRNPKTCGYCTAS